MKKAKRRRLERAGWRIGEAKEFLDLSPEEVALIKLKQSLVALVRKTRVRRNLTQTALAALLESSQSRVAKLESESRDVSLDLIVRTLFALGLSTKELGKVIAAGN